MQTFRFILIETLAFLSVTHTMLLTTRVMLVFFRFGDQLATDRSRVPARPCKSVHLWPVVPHPLLQQPWRLVFVRLRLLSSTESALQPCCATPKNRIPGHRKNVRPQRNRKFIAPLSMAANVTHLDRNWSSRHEHNQRSSC